MHPPQYRVPPKALHPPPPPLFGEYIMNRSTVAKVLVLPAAVAQVVTRTAKSIFRTTPAVEQTTTTARRHAGVFTWRPAFRPDGLPDALGEIVPVVTPRKSGPHKPLLH